MVREQVGARPSTASTQLARVLTSRFRTGGGWRWIYIARANAKPVLCLFDLCAYSIPIFPRIHHSSKNKCTRSCSNTVYVYFERGAHPTILLGVPKHRAVFHCKLPGRSSIVHQIGLVVLIVTVFSSGMRWFDVDTRPSKDDSASAAGPQTSARTLFVMHANVRTKVPAQAGRGENSRADADREQPAGRAEDGVVYGYVMGALGLHGCELCRLAASRRGSVPRRAPRPGCRR